MGYVTLKLTSFFSLCRPFFLFLLKNISKNFISKIVLFYEKILYAKLKNLMIYSKKIMKIIKV